MRLLISLLLPTLLVAQEPFSGLTPHQAPAPIPEKFPATDWPRFLGPTDDNRTPEAPLLEKFPAEGLPLLFELDRGESYASPIIAQGRLLHFHSVKSAETLDCLDLETGKRNWTFSYPIEYRDRYGFSEGPRSSPVVADGRIYLIGVTARLHCLDLKTGEVFWKRDLQKDFSIPQYFFGYGPNPVLHGEKLILNLGGKPDGNKGACVAALSTKDGSTLWTHEDDWGASYASPVIAELHGKKVALVLAAGESRPPHGGLLALDPDTGKLHSRFPWRSELYESVLASSPLALPGNRVFISDCYQKGGVLLQFDQNLKPTTVWKNEAFGMHMMVPQLIDQTLYGFAGRNIPDTELKAVDLATGKIRWTDEMRWEENERVTGLFRGSFLRAADRLFSLGEDGAFCELKLTPEGPEILQKTRLFTARETWTPPVLSHGLLYICENTAGFDDTPRRLLCYDFRPQKNARPAKKALLQEVTPAQAKALLASPNPPTILDLRTPGEFKKGHLENALNLDVYDPAFLQKIGALDPSKPSGQTHLNS